MRQGRGREQIENFYEIDEWMQCELLIELIERIVRTHVRSLEALAEKEGRSPDVIWAAMCKERGVELCTIPERVPMVGRA